MRYVHNSLTISNHDSEKEKAWHLAKHGKKKVTN